jgi:hypothetical protein
MVIAAPHTHLTGKSISTKIIRDGVNIGYLDYNKYYDFNYQELYILNPRIEITQVKKNKNAFSTVLNFSIIANFDFKINIER